ncbi:MAG: cysteine--tRNA ligase [Nanobdellota archaeon]
MALKLYNTLTRKKEIFQPIEEGKVKMYCCGPTVYNYAHIGNLRTYIFEDILRRTLEYNEFEVNHVMNITDVGHLTDDGDEGEDKLEKSAEKEKKSVLDISKFYTDAFFEDINKLNIKSPHIPCKATEHINDMIDMIKKLEDNGYTYESGGNIYYDISQFKYYADLGNLNLEQMKSTERVEEDTGKRNKQDFVLWFTSSKFKNHSLKWDSPWGTGYPGWHIECSAMSVKYLGPKFDIHCGGVDHIQVHHTNEIAQTEGAYNVHPTVNYWVHGEFLILNKGKMSKSDGSFITLRTLEEKGYDPSLYRFYCLNAHYRQKLNFSFEALDNAKSEFESLKKKIVSINEFKEENKGFKEIQKSTNMLEFEHKFLEAINDDLNMPKALKVMNEVIKSNLDNPEKYVLIEDFDRIFGLGLSSLKSSSQKISQDEYDEIKPLLDKREEARKNKDFETADKIRDDLKTRGYSIKDTSEGQEVNKEYDRR